MPRFSAEVTVACDPERAFAFLLRPENVLRISPPELGLVFLAPPTEFTAGQPFEFKIQSFGQVQTLIHQIEQLTPPREIVEVQVKGPFKSWRHVHSVEPAPQGGGTVLRDDIEFEPPGGILGLLISADRILDQLEDGFYHRHEQLRKCLNS